MITPALVATLYVLLVIACVAALRPKSRLDRAIRSFVAALGRIGRRRWLAFTGIFLSVIVVRLAVLPLLSVPTPGIHDEFAYLLQADTFCHGRLANPPHPMWKSFETFHENFFPTYSSMYPPAQGAFLALGQLLGRPWIGVILSAALMCGAIYWALCAWIPPRWAFLAGSLAALKLCVATYWINSFWGGAAAAIGGALVLGGMGRILRRPSALNAVLLGIGASILANSRPFEGALFCLPVSGVFLYWLAGKTKTPATPRERMQRVLLPLAAILFVNFAFMGYYNWRLTGNPREFPELLNSRKYDVGAIFLWQVPKPPREYNNAQFDDFYNGWERDLYKRTWGDFKEITYMKYWRLRVTYGWWGLLCALPGILYLFRRKRMRLPLVAAGFVLAGLFVITWPYPHYFAPATAVFYACAALAIRATGHWQPGNKRLGTLLSRVVVLTLVLDVTTSVVTGRADATQWGGERLPSRVAILKKLDATPDKHLVMVRYTEEHPADNEWVYNGADIDGSKVIWAREMDPGQDEKLFEYYRDRKIWLVKPDELFPSLLPYSPPKEERSLAGRSRQIP
jgi:hypothetical protein